MLQKANEYGMHANLKTLDSQARQMIDVRDRV